MERYTGHAGRGALCRGRVVAELLNASRVALYRGPMPQHITCQPRGFVVRTSKDTSDASAAAWLQWRQGTVIMPAVRPSGPELKNSKYGDFSHARPT